MYGNVVIDKLRSEFEELMSMKKIKKILNLIQKFRQNLGKK